MVRMGRTLGPLAFMPQTAPLTFFLHLLDSFADLSFEYFRLVSCHCSPDWYHCGQSQQGLRHKPQGPTPLLPLRQASVAALCCPAHSAHL